MEAIQPTPTFKPLIGTEEATIDEKGRVMVAKKKRDRLGDDFVLALTMTGCVAAYPSQIWQKMVDEMLSGPANNFGREQYTRLMLGTADDDLNFDQQGRLIVPAKLRKAVGLDQKGAKLLLIGCGDRMEIWLETEWEIFNRFPDEYGRQRRDAILVALERMGAARGRADAP